MKHTVEQLSEKLVLVEPGDLQGLAEVHTLLEEIAAAAAELSAPWAGPLSQASADAVQRVILDEAGDPIAALEEVAQAVTALQRLIVDEREPGEVPLPEAFAAALGGAADPPPAEAATVAESEVEVEVEGEARAEAEPLVDSPADALADAPAGVDDAAAAGEPGRLTGDPELTAEFVAEATEHLDTANACLLTIEANPGDQDTLNALFRAFHTIKGVAGFLELADVMRLAHQTENLLDAARQGQLALDGPRLDAVFDATDAMTRLVGFVAQAIQGDGTLHADPGLPALIQRLDALRDGASGGAADPAEGPAPPVDEPAGPTDPEPTAAPVAAEDDPPPPGPAPASDADMTSPAGSPAAAALRETVKVDSTRLDQMIDTIGELVIAEAMVTQSPELRACIDDAMERRLSHLSKITRELQEMATSLRLMPIRSTFQRMARLARDTAKKLGKPIEFVTAGDETELDKNVVDQIGDPLVHMVRNAVDHGLEDSPEPRAAAGKPDAGRVELRAYHRGGGIYIEISDDGRGLDRERIIAKAVERGLVKPDEKLTDQEVYQLVMEPGFSTAKVVSDVSGRGVGMDVVRKNIQKMRGQIEIQSTPGRGTTFVVRLPLTLAIIDGMVVRVADQRYVIPLLSITRMLRPDSDRVPTVFHAAEMLQADDGLIPLFRLHRLFDIADAQTDPTRASVVVVEHEGKRAGLMIDELLGQQQIVIKSLGESMRGTEGIAGGAIMPDGKVGLILDLDSLLRLAASSPAAPSLAAA